ncbi:thioesterase, menaquinone synthesis protein [Acidimicrobium ferrooxidans DSM 10331]|uniref:Thioesterase, menaquinone synthesis protein n=1 Tax=Acidimicrobium ferrooxidans (strain DSM 10331 / JCM 15462 / NBRC 103882 / ICP) TaxID=525909 RepID=C7M0N5_ACIFD|nr:alpha/beta fold hydrolase [Acidimicrobium ferrooxidans]ACU54543.1 thioesterase, menaquinone synthesis protein [Acidimicrobium ferrooxidans DSM 10331]
MTNARARNLLGPTGAVVEVTSTGGPERRAVVLHGFTQSRWSLIGTLLPVAEGIASEIVFLDAPGHGANLGPSSVRAFLDAVAELDPDIVIGYSMGGRLALWLAAVHPELEAEVIAFSAHPGIEAADARAERRRRDEALADRLDQLARPRALGADASNVDAFLDEWDSQPLFARRRLSERRRRGRALADPSGWAHALRAYGTGSQPDLTEALAHSRARLALVVGTRDTAYVAHAARLRHRAHIVTVPNVGHDVLAEAPEIAQGIVLGLLAARRAPTSAP